VLQPTQAPAPALQMGEAAGHDEESAQGAWHACVPGQQARAEAGQSALVAQAAQTPVPATHTGVDPAQSVSRTQSTQPSAASHFWLPRHCTVPFTPQSAVPLPNPLLLAPPQAMTAATSAAAKKTQDLMPRPSPSSTHHLRVLHVSAALPPALPGK